MDDEYLTTAQKAVEGFAETRIIGKFWAEYYPFQRHLPSWFPGGNFKQVAGYYRPFVDKMVNMPFEATKTQMVPYHILALSLYVLIDPSGGRNRPRFRGS